MRYPRQTVTLTLAQLQAAGFTSGGDFAIGVALPTDAIIIGMEVQVIEGLAGPTLVSAKATIFAIPNPISADLTTIGLYQSGGQQLYLSIALTGDQMALLTAGSLTATVYYTQASTPTYELAQIT
jgi:hypothetical protein